MISRRTFARGAAAGAAALAIPFYARAAGKPQLVVIGGGAGGASLARHVAEDSKGSVEITLIEPSETYVTCFFSNLFLGGFRSIDSITHRYDRLVSDFGIKKVTGRADRVDRDGRAVIMADGAKITYDRLVVAPGIDFIWDSLPGYGEDDIEIAPHAYKAGPQTLLLKDRLEAIGDGKQIVIVPPPDPYRCPPAPYERASMMAHSLKSRGVKAKIIILDPKPKFSKQGLFQAGWETHYPGMIEWYGPDIHGGILGVNAKEGAVETDFDTFSGALLNIIPAQKAGAIGQSAGLTDETGFCPVEAETMRSVRDERIFVIGDASIAGDMPKSAFAANSQAKVAASAVLSDLTGAKAYSAHFANSCWSLIDTEDSIKVGGTYEPRDGRISATSHFISAAGETAAIRKTSFEESLSWYDQITADIFGGSG